MGSISTKCISSQLETVISADLASISALYKKAFRRIKKGQNAHNSGARPYHAEKRYLSMNLSFRVFS
jgi:hypothetical protein